MIKMKRVLALAVATLLLFLCVACNGQNNYVMDISGARLDPEVYLYYYDQVKANPQRYNLPQNPTQEELERCIQQLCAQYVAANSLFAQQGKKLQVNESATVSKKVNDIWRVFHAHYTDLGISKQTIYKIYSSQTYADKLFLSLYDTDGERAIPEATVQQYFRENYVVFQVINGYFLTTDVNGNSVAMSLDEENALRAQFANMQRDLAGGKSIVEVQQSYLGSQNDSVPIIVLHKDSNTYPSGFFDAIAKLSDRQSNVLEYSNSPYIFLVQKLAVDFENGPEYWENRENCLKALKGAEFDAELQQIAAQYKVVRMERAMEDVLQNAGL